MRKGMYGGMIIDMDVLAKTMAEVTPMKPKNGADVGHNSLAIFNLKYRRKRKRLKPCNNKRRLGSVIIGTK